MSADGIVVRLARFGARIPHAAAPRNLDATLRHALMPRNEAKG